MGRASGEVGAEQISRIMAVLRNFYICFNLYGVLLAGDTDLMGWNLVYQEQSSYEDRSGIAVAVSCSRTDLLVSGNG